MEYQEDLGFQIRTLSHLVKRTVDQTAFAGEENHPTGVQGWIIGYLYENRGKEVFQRDIQAQFSIRRSTVTGILQLMEKNGLITRSSVERDARLKKLELTPRAIQLHERIGRSVRQVEERLNQSLTPQEKQEFLRLCGKIRASLQELSARPVRTCKKRPAFPPLGKAGHPLFFWEMRDVSPRPGWQWPPAWRQLRRGPSPALGNSGDGRWRARFSSRPGPGGQLCVEGPWGRSWERSRLTRPQGTERGRGRRSCPRGAGPGKATRRARVTWGRKGRRGRGKPAPSSRAASSPWRANRAGHSSGNSAHRPSSGERAPPGRTAGPRGRGQGGQQFPKLGCPALWDLPQKGQGQVQGFLPGVAGAGGEGPQPLLRLAQGSPRRRGKGEGEEQPHSRAAAHAAS